ncbi:enhancer of polycomb homolog 1 [Cimex lectularius]|uniref:Enhancer of polycomb-like protein n=1 Tax=Cimex lectularius TaxID=79782 RepID=A0A8I6RH83_CIMLE|nr:enhancer of polycomb homolog 1 [Cimex lectularius]
MSKLSIRARQLDATKPLPIYRSEELPDLPEYSAINRAVAQMPSGMKKTEECEHHLQRAIVTGLIIPTPEVECMEDMATYDRLYPANYKPPWQLIHMQSFSMEEEVPDYDIDSEDEKWLSMQKLDITPLKFEEMMDRLEKNCAQNFASQNRKELLLKDDDELSIAIFDYWLSKRLSSQPHPLVPCIKTEVNNRGTGGNTNYDDNPYLAFRRRTDKMQTRKNRKSDETSYEKMVKLRRDLSRALQLLEMVKRRETAKKELVDLTVQLYEKRYHANDLSGALLAEVSTFKSVRPAFAPIYTNQYTPNHSHWTMKPPKDEVGNNRKEKRQYKKRKHKTIGLNIGERPGSLSNSGGAGSVVSGSLSSGDDEPTPGVGVTSPPQSPQVAFPFHRNKNCTYQAPLSGGGIGNWSWSSPEEGGSGEERYRFSLASVTQPKPTCVGLVRRRIGRGGRVILDRAGPSMDDFWSSLDFTILDNAKSHSDGVQLQNPPPFQYSRHFRPKTPPSIKSEPDVDSDCSLDSNGLLQGSTLCVQVESLTDCDSTAVELDLGELFPDLELDALRCELGGKRPRKGGGNTSVSSTELTTSGLDSASGELGVSPDPLRSGSSEFVVTDDRWRGGGDSSPPLSSSLTNHKLPPPPSESVLQCDRIPPFMANGPINHTDCGGWGQQQSSGSQQSYKWSSSSGNSLVPVTSSSQATNSLNAKLAARTNSSQLNNDPGGSGDMHKRPTGSSGQAAIVHNTPMEVT